MGMAVMDNDTVSDDTTKGKGSVQLWVYFGIIIVIFMYAYNTLTLKGLYHKKWLHLLDRGESPISSSQKMFVDLRCIARFHLPIFCVFGSCARAWQTM